MMLNKNDFDAALTPNFRSLTNDVYKHLRKAESNSFSELLDNNGNFIKGVALSRNCPVCETFFATENYFVHGMHIVTYQDCGFTYSREVIKQSYDKQRYVSLNSISQHTSLKQNSSYRDLEIKKAQYVVNRLSEHLFPSTCPIEMLDVGSSSGALLLAARQRNWKAEGVEANATMVEICGKENLNVIEGFFPEVIQDSGKKYDVITLLDVLEHVGNPIELSLSSKEFLKTGGLVAIQVPNFQSLAIRLEGESNNNFCHGHWSYFTPQTLNMVMEKAGFENLFLETYISEFDKIQQFPEAEICRVVHEITGKPLDDINDLTIDWLHENLLGYKIFGIYRLKQ